MNHIKAMRRSTDEFRQVFDLNPVMTMDDGPFCGAEMEAALAVLERGPHPLRAPRSAVVSAARRWHSALSAASMRASGAFGVLPPRASERAAAWARDPAAAAEVVMTLRVIASLLGNAHYNVCGLLEVVKSRAESRAMADEMAACSRALDAPVAALVAHAGVRAAIDDPRMMGAPAVRMMVRQCCVMMDNAMNCPVGRTTVSHIEDWNVRLIVQYIEAGTCAETRALGAATLRQYAARCMDAELRRSVQAAIRKTAAESRQGARALR
jgi:hypothetical protein